MKDQDKTKQQLLAELAELRRQVAALETAATEGRQAEEERRRSEAKWRSVAENAPLFVAVVDRLGNMQFLNRYRPGFTPETVLGRPIYDFLDPRCHAIARECLERVFRTGEHGSYESVGAGSEGSEAEYTTDVGPVVVDGQVIAATLMSRDITERNRSEADVAKHRAMLQATIECLPFDFFAIGNDGHYLMENAVCRASWGPLAGNTPQEMAPADGVRALWLENNRRAFAGEKVEGEAEVTVKGEERVVYQVITPIRDESHFYGILGVNIDITERKRAEEALRQARDELEQRVEERTAELRESERRFRNYFEQGLIGMAVTSVDKRWLEVNDRLCEMLGYSREELVQTDWTSLTHPDDIEPNLRLFNPLLAGEIEHFTLNKRYIKKDGSFVHTTIHTRAFRLDDGTIDHIVTLIENITARKEAEEALRQSHAQLRAIYDGMCDGIVIVDIERPGPVRANAAICRMLGYTEEELKALVPSQVHPQEAMPKILEHLQAVAQGQVVRFDNMSFLRKDGGVFYADVVSSRILYNERLCRISFLHDVTERKQAQDALEQERQSLWRMLQASDHERQIISYDIHDGLAQYLAAAGMQLQVFEQLRDSNPEEAKKAFDAATQLVSQSHTEARRLISEVRPPVIDEIGLETAVAHLVHEQRQRGGPQIELQSDVQFGRLASILENALYRIAQEALTNACKHSKSKKVLVAMTQEEQEVRLGVQDWGIGFDPESVEKGHFGLEGIRQRVRLLGGRLKIESTPGSGTLVEVVVPVVERQAER